MNGTVTPNIRMPPNWSNLLTCLVPMMIASVLLMFRSKLFLMCQPVTALAQDYHSPRPDENSDLMAVCNCVNRKLMIWNTETWYHAPHRCCKYRKLEQSENQPLRHTGWELDRWRSTAAYCSKLISPRRCECSQSKAMTSKPNSMLACRRWLWSRMSKASLMSSVIMLDYFIIIYWKKNKGYLNDIQMLGQN